MAEPLQSVTLFADLAPLVNQCLEPSWGFFTKGKAPFLSNPHRVAHPLGFVGALRG